MGDEASRRVLLFGIAAAGLAAGLLPALLGHGAAGWIFTLGTLPVLAALLHEIHECAGAGVAEPRASGDSAAASPTTGQSSLTQAFMRGVLRAPDARLTVASCASRLGVTAGHLAEQIVADTGSTPGRILRSAVAREAQRLLTGTDLSAAQISYRLGFSEASYFSRFFRREVGCTPTEYRGIGAHAAAPARKERHAG